MPGNILITAMVMCLGWQMARAVLLFSVLLYQTGWNSSMNLSGRDYDT